MTIILGAGGCKLSYDFFGVYVRRHDIAIDAPDAILGDTSIPPMMQLGTFQLCGDVQDVQLSVDVTQER